MFFAELICTFAALFYIWFYIVRDVHIRTHRLLPLIMGLVAVYDFYQMVELVTGAGEVFIFLEDLLFIQMSYLFLCYLLDFLKAKIPLIVHIVLMTAMLIANIRSFLKETGSDLHANGVLHFCIFCAVLSIALITWVFIRSSYNKKKMFIDGLFSISVVSPIAIFIIEKIYDIKPGIFLSVAFGIIYGIVSGLLSSGLIVDSEVFLGGQVYQNSEFPMLLFDSENKFLSANDKAQELFPELRQGRIAMLKIRKQKLELPFDFSKKYNDLEEEINGRYYIWNIDAVNENDKKRGYIVQLVDITEQKNETVRMQELKRTAEEQSIMKARFLANTSHELRSPLHAIIGTGEVMLSRQDISYKTRVMAYNIVESGNSLLKIVNSILDFSKLEAGQYKLSKRPYDIDNMLRDLTQMALVNIGKRPVRFSIDIVTQYPKTIIGDELCVRNMLQNLISNAIKFTQEGEINCKLEFFMDGNSLQMSCHVKDTGAGMPKELLDKIFTEYTSFAGDKAKEGTGLGLSNVRMLSHLMGGDVIAMSDGFSGSTIGFYINQEFEPEDEIREPIVFDENNQGSYDITIAVLPDYIFPGARVLITDDMQINRQIFIDMTEAWEFQITEAADGDEAVELVKNQDFDLIFLDLKMPRMPGDVAVTEIKKITDTPVILLSANLLEDVKEEYYEKGFSRVLTKPLDMYEVKSAIEELIPVDKRIAVDNKSKLVSGDLDKKNLESRLRTYRIFENEIKTMTENLLEEYHKDINLFQTRVHGMKGAARQLGMEYIANQSEIMEMAAKAGHTSYIDNNINFYIEEMKYGLEEVELNKYKVEAELEKIISKEEKSDAAEGMLTQDSPELSERVSDLFAQLKTGFEQYKMDAIESSINQLKSLPLNPEQREKLDAAEAAMDDFDYEAGAELFD